MSHKKVVKVLCYCCVILGLTTALTNNDSNKSPSGLVGWRDFGRDLVQCLASDDKVRCLQMRVIEGLDAAILDNSTWEYSDFLLFEKNSTTAAGNQSEAPTLRQSRALSFADTIGEKLLHLAERRTVRLKLPPAQAVIRVPAGISDAVEELDGIATSATTANPITIPINDDEFGAITGVAGLTNADEGRKKKDKDKHMASLGGMAMMAMMAQMFFGKVLLIAGTAFIMAKIALLVSLLGSLKKGSTGSSGNTDHVIVTSGGGGHDSPGWHRSMPYEVPKLEISHAEDQHYDSPPMEYEHSSSSSSGPPPSHTLSKPPPDVMAGPPSQHYYNYETPGEESDTGPPDAGSYRRRNTAGFL